MSNNSAIQWTEATWNPVTGCTRVSAGCDHCYAVTMTNRLEGMGQKEKYGGLTVLNPAGERHFNGVVRCHDDELTIPIRRKKPTVYFVNSMSDLFHKNVPFDFIDKVFAVMALCPQHTFQVLTKRPERMAEYFSRSGIDPGALIQVLKLAPPNMNMADTGLSIESGKWNLKNVWLGTSVEDQQCADERIPHLLRCPAAVRFLSVEPMLSEINLGAWMVEDAPDALKILSRHYGAAGFDETGKQAEKRFQLLNPQPLHWVIVGGESGPGARPFNLGWARSIVAQCKSAGVPCFVKQLGKSCVQQCANCKKMVGHCMGGMVDSCGPAHAALANECFNVRNSKGGDISEWPADLRVREMPKGLVQA